MKTYFNDFQKQTMYEYLKRGGLHHWAAIRAVEELYAQYEEDGQ